MAYNSSYNPDALPAHAEPEQVAQMIGAMQSSHPHRPRASSHSAPPGHPPRRISPAIPSQGPHPPPQAAQHHYPRKPSAGAATGQYNYGIHSPPPQNYGFGPPPPRPAQNRPPPVSRPPHSPNPPLATPNDDPKQLFPLFRAANVSHSGALTEAELGSALVNGDYTAFDPNTVKMMVRMFDKDGNGTIRFDEFVSLWRYLAAWREIFDRFDEDRSGRISLGEFEKALVAFGYRLSEAFIGVLFSTFESKGRRRNGPGLLPGKPGMSFDLFIQCCMSLRRMTEVFKRYDDDRDGYITVSFEEFLTEILQLQD
ncbi:hypothetical protein Plec18167_006713 [Paecilomyces lecythidis]|uniref:EF-hand domain-containing protein n=1 Tax=Paecilomyces lecythidis TaxID=3004212 RepID=A0ABR3XAA7_9EURO